MRRGYTPVFDVAIDGRRVTDILAPILVSATVTDGVGIESDRVEITVDNRGGLIERPRKGAILTCSGGYRESGLVRFGTYEIEDSTWTLPRRELTVTARAAAPGGKIKERKYRAFEETTVGELVRTIAKDNDLMPAVDPELADVPVPYRAQMGESDANLLSWLGKRLSAVSTAKDGHLIFAAQGSGFAGIAAALPQIRIGLDDLEGDDALTVQGCARGRYGKIVAGWRDLDEGATREELVDALDETRQEVARLTELFQTKEEAKAVAEAKRKGLERSEETLSAKLSGTPDARAEAVVVVAVGDAEADGPWSADSVTHEFSGSDVYVTTISAVRKERAKGVR